MAQNRPACYVVFDQLYQGYRSLMPQPLQDRRRLLQETVQVASGPCLNVSEGVIGPGKAFFEQVLARQLEGVVAKRLDSPYRPGKRCSDWIKVRKSQSLLCAIIGFVPKGDDFESLILAAEQEGQLSSVGRVGTGFDQALRDRLNRTLRRLECQQPLVPCREKGSWVQPVLCCWVRFFERTPDGRLREPVFERLIEEGQLP